MVKVMVIIIGCFIKDGKRELVERRPQAARFKQASSHEVADFDVVVTIGADKGGC